MILDGWLTVVRNCLYGDAITAPTHVAIGTGTTAVTGADTTLETEVLRAACTNGKVGTDIVSYTKTWATTDGNGNDFTEACAVNAASAGALANRKVFPAFSKTSSYELRVSIYIKSENNL
jgi:hypothetical protein